MLHTLERTQTLPVSLESAWEFFSDPGNLCRITPQWLRFKVTCGQPEPMYAGQILTYTVQALPGVTTSWITEITHVDKPFFFVDEQRMGPYAFWHHQHRFREEDGRVLMQDIVSYALPLGPLGELLHRLFVRRRLAAIFDFRQEVLEGMFSARPLTGRGSRLEG